MLDRTLLRLCPLVLFCACPALGQEARRLCPAGSTNYTIAYGDTVDCTLSTAITQRVDFEAVRGEFVGIHMTRVSGSGTPCATIENASGVALFSRFCDTVLTVPNSSRAAVQIPADGRYRIAVSESGSQFAPFQYHLNLERLAPPTASAMLIAPNQKISGSINPRGDRDFFRFQVAAGDRYAFILRRLAGSAEPSMQLLDALGATRTLNSETAYTAAVGGTLGMWLRDSGDNEVFEYEVTFVCQGQCPRPSPVVTSVVNSANGTAGVCSGAWVTVFGKSMATIWREWEGRDFVGTKMPTELEGVSVTFGGKRASVYFVSPEQLNVILPNTPPGTVEARVNTTAGQSEAFSVRVNEYCPAAFQLPDQRYVIGILSDGVFAQSPTFAPTASRQARAGDIISIYTTGLGQTRPTYPEGEINPVPLATLSPVRISVGGVYAEVFYAGLVSPGLYQINFRIPVVPVGEQPLRIELGDVRSPEQVSLLIGR